LKVILVTLTFSLSFFAPLSAQEVLSSTILEKGKILYTKSEATIFIDALRQAEVGVA